MAGQRNDRPQLVIDPFVTALSAATTQAHAHTRFSPVKAGHTLSVLTSRVQGRLSTGGVDGRV